MDRYTVRIYGLALLLSLHLLCSAPTAQSVDDEKINFPYGLCVNGKPCKDGWLCLCCLANLECYSSMDACKKDCLKPSVAGIMSMTMTRSTLPAPLPPLH
ncbi:hypothetical protein VPH35_017718 [Triticum aestivum]